MTALRIVVSRGGGFATFMMHSFSFIEKVTCREGEPSPPGAIFTSEDVFGWHTDVYGARPEMRQAFSSFLDSVSADPRLRVQTLAEAQSELRMAAVAGVPDMVPVISGS